jgi:D-alanine-D-alanine ligase
VKIGISYDLKHEFQVGAGEPEDRLEEYDSEATVEAIARALAARGHTPLKLGGGRALVERVLAAAPDLVFNIAEGYGTRSREAHVPAVLELLRIPFTHSDPLTLAVTLDKGIAKRLVATAGLPTPRFRVLESARELDDAAPMADHAGQPLRLPLFAKPLYEGSSMGIRRSSRLEEPAALRARVEALSADYKQPVLVEEFCSGPEFTVGILGNGEAARPIAVMEVVPRKVPVEDFVYSLEVKRNYLEEVEYRVPPDRPRELLAEIERVALGCYRALGCRDVARVDVRIAADGQPKFLEVNPLPGVHPVTGDIVIMSKRVGRSYEELINGIVDAARARCGI